MQKFDTPAPISAVLDIPAGRIRFIAADRADTTVEVLPAERLKPPRREGGGADQGRIQRRRPADRGLGARTSTSGRSGSVEVTVQLPAGSRVEAKAASAELRSVGRLGDVTFDGSHASIKLDEAASARLTTVDGDVSVGRLGGDAQISTARGDIQVAEAARGKVVLGTQAGDDLGRRRRRRLGLPGRRHRLRPHQQRPARTTAPPT